MIAAHERGATTMQATRTIRLGLSGAAVFALVVVAGLVWRGSVKSPSTGDAPWPEGRAILGSASFRTAADRSDAERMASEVADAVRRQEGIGVGDPTRLSNDRARRLASIVEERVVLYLRPEPIAYLESVRSLSTRPFAEVEPLIDVGVWERGASAFDGMPMDPLGVRVRAVRVSGIEVPPQPMRMTWQTGGGLYFDPGQGVPGGDVYQVLIPARVVDSMNPAVRFDAFLALAFVWHGPAGRWVPWRVGVGTAERPTNPVLVPWI